MFCSRKGADETMPAMNGTGPQGAGPMTGKGQGLCNNSDTTAPFNGRGRGMGMGRRNCGIGFGQRGFRTAVGATPQQQKDMLNRQKVFLENQIACIDKQIQEL